MCFARICNFAFGKIFALQICAFCARRFFAHLQICTFTFCTCAESLRTCFAFVQKFPNMWKYFENVREHEIYIVHKLHKVCDKMSKFHFRTFCPRRFLKIFSWVVHVPGRETWQKFCTNLAKSPNPPPDKSFSLRKSSRKGFLHWNPFRTFSGTKSDKISVRKKVKNLVQFVKNVNFMFAHILKIFSHVRKFLHKRKTCSQTFCTSAKCKCANLQMCEKPSCTKCANLQRKYFSKCKICKFAQNTFLQSVKLFQCRFIFV